LPGRRSAVGWLGGGVGVWVLASADLTLWRWFFFGLGLVVMMLYKPEGLAGRRSRASKVEVDEREEATALVAASPPVRADQIPHCLPDPLAQAGAAAPGPARPAAPGPST